MMCERIILHIVIHFAEDAVFLQLVFWPLHSKKMFVLGVQASIWVLNSVPLISMSIFMPVTCCSYYNGSVV